MKLTDNVINKNRSCSNLPKLNKIYNNAYLSLTVLQNLNFVHTLLLKVYIYFSPQHCAWPAIQLETLTS